MFKGPESPQDINGTMNRRDFIKRAATTVAATTGIAAATERILPKEAQAEEEGIEQLSDQEKADAFANLLWEKANAAGFGELTTAEEIWDRYVSTVLDTANELSIPGENFEDVSIWLFNNGYFVNREAIFYGEPLLYKIEGVKQARISDYPSITLLIGESDVVYPIATINSGINGSTGYTSYDNRVYVDTHNVNNDVRNFGVYAKDVNPEVFSMSKDEHIKRTEENELWHLIFADKFPNLHKTYEAQLTNPELMLRDGKSPTVLELNEFLSDAVNIITDPTKLVLMMDNIAFTISEASNVEGKLKISDRTPELKDYSYSNAFILQTIETVFANKGVNLNDLLLPTIKANQHKFETEGMVWDGSLEEYMQYLRSLINESLGQMNESDVRAVQSAVYEHAKLCVEALEREESELSAAQ